MGVTLWPRNVVVTIIQWRWFRTPSIVMSRPAVRGSAIFGLNSSGRTWR